MQRDARGKTVRIDLLVDVETGLPLRRDNSASGQAAKQPASAALPVCCRAVLQSLYDAAIMCDINGQIIEFNNRALDFLRYSYDEFCQLAIFDIVSGTSAQLLATIQENLKKQQFTLIQAYCHRKDGSVFPAEIVISQIAPESPHLTFFLRDISVRRHAEEQLRTEHAALQNAANGIAITDQTGHIIYVNPAMAQMWAYSSPEKMCGRAITELFADAATAGQTISANLSAHETWTGELRARRRNGEEFSIQVSAALNRNANDELAGLIFSFLDVSARALASAAQQEAERQRVMIESFGTACHLLGQPATVLLANLDMLGKELGAASSPAARALLTEAMQAAEHLRDMLQKLNATVVYRPTPYSNSASAPASPDDRADDSHIIDI
jgi:PAS domain S-box-containing protein